VQIFVKLEFKLLSFKTISYISLSIQPYGRRILCDEWALRIIRGHERKATAWSWRNEKLRPLSSSSTITKTNKSSRFRWAEHVTFVRRLETYRIFVVKPETGPGIGERTGCITEFKLFVVWPLCEFVFLGTSCSFRLFVCMVIEKGREYYHVVCVTTDGVWIGDSI
jgi:hypothetical protein